jgi:hypothetical protein
MSDMLREIEKGHEARYKLDEESRFKARCRRAKLFGLWAAERMGLADAEAREYAKSMVRLDIDQPGTDAAVQAVIADFRRRNVTVTEQEAVAAFDRYLAEALEQLAGEFPTALDTDHGRVGD